MYGSYGRDYTVEEARQVLDAAPVQQTQYCAAILPDMITKDCNALGLCDLVPNPAFVECLQTPLGGGGEILQGEPVYKRSAIPLTVIGLALALGLGLYLGRK